MDGGAEVCVRYLFLPTRSVLYIFETILQSGHARRWRSLFQDLAVRVRNHLAGLPL